jgi:hypothetical protein
MPDSERPTSPTDSLDVATQGGPKCETSNSRSAGCQATTGSRGDSSNTEACPAVLEPIRSHISSAAALCCIALA